MNSDTKGRLAEYVAGAYLLLCGHRILKLRYKTRVGEIDLIARKGRYLIFVEVKKRKTLDDAAQAVSNKSQHRIRRAAEYFLLAHPKLAGNLQPRFDVVGIASYHHIRHLENAF